MLRNLRVFLSSPGDVNAERDQADEVLNDLGRSQPWRERFTFQVVRWDDRNAATPMDARLTPQQAIDQQLPLPSRCDIVVVILWSRMGTPIASPLKEDGTQYQSGTEWEFEDALRGSGSVLVFRRLDKPKIEIDDPEPDNKRAQYNKVRNFFASFIGPDGSIRRSTHDYNGLKTFRPKFKQCIEGLLTKLMDEDLGQVSDRDPARTPIVADPSKLAPGSRFKDVDAAWCPEMVIMPAGRFTMGSPDSDPDAYDDEKPAHEVAIGSFAMGRYLVTFDEFDAFCADTKRQNPRPEGRWERYPVTNVCWDDARAFVAWLAAKTRKPYRLPTEAEWEYACRAGTTTRFYRGNQLSVKHANYDKAVGRTTPVGSYPANPWGLYDMHGNLWEHVEDAYHESYTGAPSDGSAWIDGGDLNKRVVRGGSYSYPPRDNRSACRCDHDVATPDEPHGFRVARSL